MDMSDEAAAAAEDLDLGGGGEAGSPDPFKEVPADGGLPQAEEAPGALGGDGATLEELGAEEEPPADEAPINGAEGDLPGAPVDPLKPDDDPPAPDDEPDPAEESPAEPDPAPEPEPEPEKPKDAKASSGKKGTAERIYHVLKKGEGGWTEPIPNGIKAANGEAALRTAYTQLVDEDSDDPLTLAVIPAHYWNPKTVQSKVKRDRAIEIV